MEIKEDSQFAILCESMDSVKPLIMHDLSFGRLLDEIIIPYEGNKAFFIDGAPLVRAKIRKLKVLIQGDRFLQEFYILHSVMQRGAVENQKILADQYHIRLEAILRQTCTDVTSQVIKAFDAKVKPHLRDYIPKREELIGAFTRVIIESLKLLQ